MNQPFSTYPQVLEYLNNIPMFQDVGDGAARFDLDRFAEALESMGNPHRQFKAIHVAGTNGKGSTCRLLAHTLQTAEQRTGLYTSPHLIDYRERIHVDGRWIRRDGVLAFFNAYKKTIEQYQLTYFEISTALAFWWFAEQNVDWAVVETGLGGRLDATNVLAPEISVITTVGLDHADLLGDTLEEIAKEKAGIIKSNTPVVIGPDNQQVLPVIRSIAEKRESKLVIAEQPAIDEGSGSSNLKAVIAHQEWWFDPGRIPVIQLNNWSVVISVVHLLNDQLGTSVQKLLTLAWQSLSASDVFKACFEQLLPHWQWYFDGGHNQQAIHTLLQTVEQVKKSERTGRQWADKQPVFVLAAMKDKVSKKSFGQFAPYPNLYYYKLNQPRATQLADLKTLLPQIRPFPHQLEAQQKWLREMRDELVIFVGSFYFYRTVRDLIEPFAST